MTKCAVMLVVLLPLTACEQWKTSARINPQTVAVYSAQDKNGKVPISGGTVDCPLTRGLFDTNSGAINLDCFQFPEDRLGGGQGTVAYDRAAGYVANRQKSGSATVSSAPAVAATPAVPDKVARDRLAAILTKHADDVCVLEKGRLLATQTTANFSLSFLSTALATASTIVGGEQAKSILSGLAAVASGTQNNVNATFYQNQLTQAITKAIDQERSRVMTQMIQARALDTAAHTVDDMVRQVNAYHQSCSFEKGLQLLLDAALDSSGANAALQARSRVAAINDLNLYIGAIDRKLADPALADETKAQLIRDRGEAQAKLHGLQMAQSTTTAAGTDTANADAPPPADPGAPPPDAPAEPDGL